MQSYSAPASTGVGRGKAAQQEARPSIHSGKYELCHGDRLAMRMWVAERSSDVNDASATRHYIAQHESVLYCLAGKAELHLEGGQKLVIEAGQSWMVPAACTHTYRVLSEEPFRALEASPLKS